MTDHELSLVVEKPREVKSEANLIAEENSEDKITFPNHDTTSRNRTTISFKEICQSFLRKWKKIFVASCLFAVLVDPLFLYIPIIKNDRKCLLLDRSLTIAALVLRSITDLFYLVDIIYDVYHSNHLNDNLHPGDRSKVPRFLRSYFQPLISKAVWKSYTIQLNILAIVPIPQVAILILFPKLRGTRSLNAKRVTMNLLVLLQFVPRVLRIYLSCKQLRNVHSPKTRETAIWVKAALNFFMYILASHVLGAIWYFFAIQRMTICWLSACRKQNDQCATSTTFNCPEDHHTFRNLTFLNDLCPVSPPNATLFDLGIYSTVLQSGIAGSTNFLQKFSNCFWWGLRHLSSLGSNLEPSIDEWENFFAAFISIIGLLLFLYLIGNLQTYMQLDTARIEAHRHKLRIEGKMEEKGKEIERWLSKNGVPERLHKDIKSQIMIKVQQELEENRNVDVDNVLPLLSTELQSTIQSHMAWSKLERVPMFKFMDKETLREIRECFKPVKYSKNQMIIEEDKPLEMMLFIVDGFLSIEKRNIATSGNSQRAGAGDFYGEILHACPSSTMPKATESVRAMSDVVEVLVLMASDVQNLAYEHNLSIKRKMEEISRFWHVDTSRFWHVDTSIESKARGKRKART